MKPAKKELSFVFILLSVIIGDVIIFQQVLVNDLCSPSPAVLLQLGKFLHKAIMFRFLYVVLLAELALLFPVQKRRDESLKYIYTATTLVLAIALMLGFSNVLSWYNLLVFPMVFIGFTILIIQIASFCLKRHVVSDKSIFGVSHEKPEFYFNFETVEGNPRIRKPQQNPCIDGGSGSGESESWIRGVIYQCTERNYAGFVYDWEGDPSRPGSPILSRIACGSIEYFKRKDVPTPAFAFIDFVDMSRTVRVNVLSEKYVPKGSESLFIHNITTTLMKNLKSSWKEEADFWANNAINYVYSTTYKCYKERAKGTGTLPHVITFALSDNDLVLRWLSEGAEIVLNMSFMLTVWHLGAQQQTAGAVSSAQTPLVLLSNKYIFQVLSPLPEEEYSPGITNPDHPTLLCISNTPSIKEAVSSPVSCIANVVMLRMNNPGKQKSIFMVDESPAVNLQDIGVFIGTARRHNVAIILVIQDFSQVVRDYEEKSANILRSSCGSQAYGMTGSEKTAEDLENLLGETKEAQGSFSHQKFGAGGVTESPQKEKVVKAREAAGQSVGHLIEKAAGGKPPYSNTQFNMCKFIDKGIPAFSKPINLEDGKEELEYDIMEEIVSQHYLSIISKVDAILEDVKNKTETDDKNREKNIPKDHNHKAWGE